MTVLKIYPPQCTQTPRIQQVLLLVMEVTKQQESQIYQTNVYLRKKNRGEENKFSFFYVR